MPSPDTHITALAADQGGVVSMRQLRDGGVSRGRRRAQVAAGRWTALPNHGVVLQRETDDAYRWWSAVIGAGLPAALGGVTALQAVGLKGFDEPAIHIWIPKSATRGVRQVGVRLHETRRWTPEDIVPVGVPRSRPAVAAVQAALWAKTPRTAILALVMPIQQRLVRPDDDIAALQRVHRHTYRRLLQSALGDIVDGAHSLNELDFARLCRKYGLPQPSRQVLLRGYDVTYHLDVRWDRYGVALEVNGLGHLWLDRIVSDDLRSMDVQLSGTTIIGLSVLTLRTRESDAMHRVGDLLRAHGWDGVAALRPAKR